MSKKIDDQGNRIPVWECSIHGEFYADNPDQPQCPGCEEWTEYPRQLGRLSNPELLEMISANRNIKVCWIDIGEGYSGDYNEDDPEDEPLLRFDVYIWADAIQEWIDPGDASYCTGMPAGSPNEMLMRGLDAILSAFQDSWTGFPADWDPANSEGWYGRNGGGYRHRLEEMSWLNPSDFTEKNK